MAENQNEKIVYDIEVRIQNAQEALSKIKSEFNSITKQVGKKLNFEADFRISGMEDFRTLQQRLAEVRKAIQYINAYKGKLAQISVGSMQIDGTSELLATEKSLRALEKTLEDMQKQINAGNFNKQIQEQQKLQKSVDTTIRKINELQKMVANSFLTDKALSQSRLNSVIDKTQKYVNDLNGLYKQLGVNARAVNPFKDYTKNYDEYFAKTNEKRLQELKAEQKHAQKLSDLRAKQNRQSNDTEFKDSQTARQSATNKLKEDIVERSKLTAIEIKEQQKLQQEYDKTVKAIDKLSNAFNRSFNNKTAWSMDKFANQFDKGEELVQKANDLSSKLGLNKTFENPMRTVFDYTDYRKQTKQALDEDELRAVKQLEIDEKRRNAQLKAEEEYTKKLSDLRAKQNRQTNDSEFRDSQTARQNTNSKLKDDILQREQLAQTNRSANENYWLNLEKQMAANTQAHKQAWEQITKVEQQYMNLLDQANLKKQLGIQLSEKEYASVQRQLKNAKERYRYEGGNPSTLPKLDTRKQFNSEAQDNFIKSMNSRMVEAMSLSTSYSEQMSKLSKILDTATYAWNKSGRTAQEYRNIMLQAKGAIDETAKSLNKLHQQTGATMGLMDKMAMGLRTHMTWILSSVAASVPLVLPGYAIGTMKNLESQFATVEQVMPEIEEAHMQSLDKNLTEMQRMEGLKKVNEEMNTFIDIGAKFGVAVEDVIKAGASIGRMYGQGENGIANTNLLTQQAARIAVADNFPIMQATKGLESALSQFGLQTEDTNQLLINSNRIIDVWTTAAHKGAASAQDLTEGVQLAGAAAHQAGVSFEFLNSLIATGVRATGRSGNEIGNSIKSFLNSMQSDKSILALKSFGIDVFKDNSDGTKSLRSMEDVILDISRMMQTTNKDTSSLLLTLAGGKYQVSKLTAILKDYKELVRMTAVLNSKDVVGFTDKQIEIQLNTLSRKLEGLHANIQGLFMDIGNNGGLDALKSVVEYIDNIVTGVRELDSSWATWTKDIILAVTALKGVPFLLNNIPKTLGGMYQRGKNNWENYSGVNIFDNAKNTISNSWNEGVTSNTGIVSSKQNETDSIDDNTRALKENEQAKNTNANSSSVLVATNQNEASSQNRVKNTIENTNQSMSNASKVAKEMGLSGQVVVATTQNIGRVSKVASVGVGALTTVMRGASAVMGAFGGPVGLAITALSIAIPLVLEYAESIGKESNAHKQLIEDINEETAIREQENNAKIRAIDAAENLSAQYEQLYQDSLNVNNSNEQQAKINEDLSATFDALKSIISSLSKENEQYTVEADENGHIILKLNGQVVNSFNDLKSASTQLTLTALKNDKARLESELDKTEGVIEATQKRIENYKDEAEALNALQQIYWQASRYIWQKRSQAARDTVNTLQKVLDSPTNNVSDEERARIQSRIDNLNNYADIADEEYANESGKLGDLSGLEEIIKRRQNDKDEINTKIMDLNIRIADLQGQVNNNQYDTGGADSDRGNYIAEPPEEKKKKDKKSKAEKQQEAYAKVGNRVALIADENIFKYGMKRTSFNGGFGEFSSGNTEIDDAISKAAQKYGLDEKWLHALVQKESSYNTRVGEGSNYKGLTQISDDKLNAGQNIWDIYDNIDAGARYFKQMLEMAGGNYRNAYVKYNAGPYAGYTQEAENNADAFVKLHDNIVNGTSDFGVTNSFNFTGLGSDVESASQWANEMVALGKYYGDTGCTAFAKAFLEQSGNSFASTMSMWTPTLMKQAKEQGLFKDQTSGFNAGDIVIADTDGRMNEPDHVVIADGNGGYWGNSTTNKRVVHGNLSDFSNIWGGVATGNGSYTPSMSSTSLQTPMRLVYDHLKSLGVELEQLNALADVTDIPSMIAKTDALGMNLSYTQKAPEAGDVVYTKDGKAYIINSTGGYGGIAGEKGADWETLDLTDTFTSWRDAIDLSLENAGSKLGKLKLSEKAEELINKRIDLDNNELQKAFEVYSEGNKSYDFEKQNVANMRSIFGEYNAEAYLKEYQNELENYNLQKITAGMLKTTRDNLENQINEYFSGGVLREVLDNNGLNSWQQLSQENLNDIALAYPDDYLKNLIDNWKKVKDRADEANNSMQAALKTVKQLNGERNPEEQLEYNLKKIQLDANFWTSNYANSHGGSYDGLDWQTDKRTHEDSIRQVRVYSEYINHLSEELTTLQQENAPKKFIEDITNAIIEARTKMNEAEKLAQETSYELSRSSRETLSGMFYDLIKGGTSFKDIWKKIWDDIAKIAIDRLLGLNDTTNGSWNLISNIFGLGKKKTETPASVGQGEKYIDDYNINNNTLGSNLAAPMTDAQLAQHKYSTEGIVDFYSKDDNVSTATDKVIEANDITTENNNANTQMQASQNMLQASQQMLQATNTESATANQNASTASMNSTNTAQDTMNTAQGTMTATQDAITSNQDSMSANQNANAASTNQSASTGMQNAANSMQSAANSIGAKAATPTGKTGGGTNIGSYLGLIPTVFSWFNRGGSLTSKDKFATGTKKGKMITNGGIVKGAGTGTSDSILAYLHDQGRFIGISNGEYIMNAKATSKYGPILEKMNLDKFADGGILKGETYVPTLRNPNIANKIAQQDVQKRNSNAKMEGLLGQQNSILQGIATNNNENSDSGKVVILNTRASKEEIFSALASDPKALQKLLGNNRRNGFR